MNVIGEEFDVHWCGSGTNPGGKDMPAESTPWGGAGGIVGAP
jgi:hypothetical protein